MCHGFDHLRLSKMVYATIKTIITVLLPPFLMVRFSKKNIF